jgi:hypothetical protein
VADQDPLLVYGKRVFGYPGPPIPSAHVLGGGAKDEDPLLEMSRRHHERMAEHTRRRELLLRSSEVLEDRRGDPRALYLRQVYGAVGLRTPDEQARWEHALRVQILTAKVLAPPEVRPETENVYR